MADRIPARTRGGQEPTAEEHDRPEQNEGYDRAARAGGARDDAWNHMDRDIRPEDPDDREAAAAAAEVRRRNRSAGE